MKIERVRSQIVRLPADEPLADNKTPPGATRDIVVVKVATKDGIDGLGVTFFGGGADGRAEGRRRRAGRADRRRRPASRPSASPTSCARRPARRGPGGIFTLALSAIDTALWDIRGKALGAAGRQAARRLRDRVPAYASGALMRTLSLDEVVTAAGRARRARLDRP